MQSPSLNLLLVEIYNSYNLAIADLSFYPNGFNIVSPTIEITPPGFNQVTIAFTHSSLNLFDSEALGITCSGEEKSRIPDGLYSVKYTINPAYVYYVEKTFMKVDEIKEKLDSLFIYTDVVECDERISATNTRKLNEINMYIETAIASANKCSNVYAMESYKKAATLIKTYSKTHQLAC